MERNLKYLPVASAGRARSSASAASTSSGLTASGRGSPTSGSGSCSTSRQRRRSEADDAFQRAAGDPQAVVAVARHGISGLGYQGFALRLAERFGDALPPGVVLVPSTAHYSFAKACRVLGMGESHLVRVPVDTHFRVDTDALEEILHGAAKQHRPVIAGVSVIATTEEGAVDRLDLVDTTRRRVGRQHGLAFIFTPKYVMRAPCLNSCPDSFMRRASRAARAHRACCCARLGRRGVLCQLVCHLEAGKSGTGAGTLWQIVPDAPMISGVLPDFRPAAKREQGVRALSLAAELPDA